MLIEAVLDDVYYKFVEVVDAVVCRILDKKETYHIQQILQSSHPFDGLQHLKRVKCCKTQEGSVLQTIICLKSQLPAEVTKNHLTLEDLFGNDSAPDMTCLLGKPCVVQVPVSAPLTRKQFEEASVYWPVHFHEDKRITKLLNSNYFNKSQEASITRHMAKALEMAKVGKSNNEHAVGAVVVDPACDAIVAAAYDVCCQSRHFLKHAVMLCVDLVARSQGGGIWKPQGSMEYLAISDITGNNAKTDSQPYLCTDYDLYVTQEPCVMCAMALVHSRIRHVFYGTSSPDGALGSRYKLHLQKNLNHHYKVFRGILSKDCETLLGT